MGMKMNHVRLGWNNNELVHVVPFTTPDDDVVMGSFQSYFSTVQFVHTQFTLYNVSDPENPVEVASSGELAPYHTGVKFHVGNPVPPPPVGSGGAGMWEGVEFQAMPDLGLEKTTKYELHVTANGGPFMILAYGCSGPQDGELTIPIADIVDDAIDAAGGFSGVMELDDGKRFKVVFIPEK